MDWEEETKKRFKAYHYAVGKWAGVEFTDEELERMWQEESEDG